MKRGNSSDNRISNFFYLQGKVQHGQWWQYYISKPCHLTHQHTEIEK